MEHNHITPEWIAQQRKVCEAASPAPWHRRTFEVIDSDGGCVCDAMWASDIGFIIDARTALPATLDALEAAYAEIARLTAERDAENLRFERTSLIIERVWRSACYGTKNQIIASCTELYAVFGSIKKERNNAPTGAESEGHHA